MILLIFLQIVLCSSTHIPQQIYKLSTARQLARNRNFLSTPLNTIPTGTCPQNPNLDCPLDSLCCPLTCCSPSFPFCTPFSSCVNADGLTECKDRDENPVLGKPCVFDEVCCPLPDFNYCTKDPPYFCVNKDGFIACSDPPVPGTYCGGETCCAFPLKCCRIGCCRGTGYNGTREIEDEYESEPAQKPISVLPIPTEDDEAEISESPDEKGEGGIIKSGKGEGSCFPAEARVETKSGQILRMDELKTGDVVKVGDAVFSEVFLWTHRDENFSGWRYVEFELEDGEKFVATTGHFVFVWRERWRILEAESIKVGDGLWKDRHIARVVKTERVRGRGLYNPHTLSGHIVVDGVLCTCYTKEIRAESAHAFLTPLRALYSGFRALTGVGWPLRL